MEIKMLCKCKRKVHVLDKVCNDLFIIFIGFETDLLLGFFFHLHKLVDGLKDNFNRNQTFVSVARL